MPLHTIISLRNRGLDWFKSCAHGSYAKAWLFFFSFTESSFLFIAPDILLIAILLVSSRQWISYAVLTTVASIIGAIFGYVIASFFFDAVGVRIINFYHLSDAFELVNTQFKSNAFWVIFTAAFTPIPYKVFVLGAGFFKINFFIFLIASILGRGMRYGIIAYAVHIFGKRANEFLSRYSILVTVAVLIVIALYVLRRLLS